MRKFGVIIAFATAAAVAAAALLLVTVFPTALASTSTLGVAWFLAGALVLLAVFALVVRMRVRVRRLQRSALTVARGSMTAEALLVPSA